MTKDQIVEMLRTDKRAVARALVVLTSRQTADEQRAENTKYLNGRGYRPAHAKMGTNMTAFFLKNGYLSDRQIDYWRKTDKTGAMRIGIYWKQLQEEIQIRAAKKSSEVVQVSSQPQD